MNNICFGKDSEVTSLTKITYLYELINYTVTTNYVMLKSVTYRHVLAVIYNVYSFYGIPVTNDLGSIFLWTTG